MGSQFQYLLSSIPVIAIALADIDIQTLPVTLSSHTSCRKRTPTLISRSHKTLRTQIEQHLKQQPGTANPRGRTNLIAVTDRDRAGQEGEDVLLGQVPVPLGGQQVEQIPVVRRQLRLPDGVGGGGAAEGPVQPRQVANLGGRQVEEHAGDAALRYVAEARAHAGAVAARERRAHGSGSGPVVGGVRILGLPGGAGHGEEGPGV